MFVETKEAGEVAEAPAKVWKLSEAIRIGARLRPPVKNTQNYFDECGSCALGAAYHAMAGHALHGATYREDGEVIRQFMCEEHGISSFLLSDICSWFHEHVSREEIADRLEAQGH